MKTIFFFSLLIILNTDFISGTTDKIICYYNGEAALRPTDGQFLPEDIDPKQCTHINYGYFTFDKNGTIKSKYPDQELGEHGLLKQVADLRTKNVNLKVLISVGAVDNNTLLRPIAFDLTRRENFANSLADLVQKYKFDGVDIDWRYPEYESRQDFIALLTSIRFKLPFGKYLLTVGMGPRYDLPGYDARSISVLVDYINIMAIDYMTAFSSVTCHSTPLYSSTRDGFYTQKNLNVNASITKWLNTGIDPQKLTLAISTMGTTHSLKDAKKHGLKDLASGPFLKLGNYTHKLGKLGYNEICEFYNDGTLEWDDEQKSSYLYKDKLWVSYEEERSTTEKVEYVKQKGLAGITVWSIDLDDTNNFCKTKTILKTVYDNINKKN